MNQTSEPDVPIRDAATIILIRTLEDVPHVLMGQRGTRAVFMPNKYVFPGGRVDDDDARIRLSPGLVPETEAALRSQASCTPNAIAAAAIRELWEETGLRLALPDTGAGADNWPDFAEQGLSPNAAPLQFIFRAITPPGRPRRFDARFLMAPAEAVHGDPDDFGAADDELGHLHWLPLDQARHLDLPFITRVVLSELEARLVTDTPRPIPFFDHALPQSRFLTL
jgi:8-oxo-dGTP pyrophosphatase MutT (NUDIX family)